MWPCVKTAVCSGLADHVRIVSCTALAWNTPLVSTTTRPSSVSTADELANASTNASPGCTSAICPLDGERVVGLDRQLAGEQLVGEFEQVHAPERSTRRLRRKSARLRRKSERVPIPLVVDRRSRSRDRPEGALARSQAARRRRVLDATLQLAAEGGFDAVQMRDVAAAADVALGTVYRYFASKERLLLEAMAEQQADLRAYLDVHPPREPTPGRAGGRRCCGGANRSLREYPDVTAAMVRSFGTAQIENADIVRRVTEIMTAIITERDPRARTAGRDRARGARRPHPHAGVALVAERLGVRGRRPRPRRRRPRRRGRPAPVLTPRRPRAHRWRRKWNVFYFRCRCRPVTSTSPTCSSSPPTRCPTALALVDARREVTYRELDERTTRLAHTLADLGREGRRPRRHPRDELHRVGRGAASRSTRSAPAR